MPNIAFSQSLSVEPEDIALIQSASGKWPRPSSCIILLFKAGMQHTACTVLRVCTKSFERMSCFLVVSEPIHNVCRVPVSPIAIGLTSQE